MLLDGREGRPSQLQTIVIPHYHIKEVDSSGPCCVCICCPITNPQQRPIVKRGEELAPAQQQDITELIDQFADFFPSMPGLTQLVHHKIKTPPGMVVRQRPFWVLEVRSHMMEEEVKWMLKDGFIKVSASPWSSPIVVAPKLDRSIHLCNDFWSFNRILFDSYSLPWEDDLRPGLFPPSIWPRAIGRWPSPQMQS